MTTKLAALMQQAAHKLEQMDYGTVIQLYQQALAIAPNNAGATMGLVMVYNRVGKPTEALTLLDKLWPSAQAAKGATAKRYKAAVLAHMGLARQQLGQLQTALDTYTQAHQLAPTTELQQRIDTLTPLVRNPLPVQQLLLHAQQQVASNQAEQARQSYAAALQLHPDCIEALRGLAALHRQRKAPQEALPLLQKALILAPDRPELYNELGMVFQDLGDFAKAASFHQRALKAAPGFVPAHINLGVAYKRQGKTNDAIAAYRAALALQPHSAAAHNNLGNLLRLAGELDQARQHLEKALELHPGYADAQNNLNDVLQALAAQAAPRPAKAPRKATSKTAPKTAAKTAANKAPKTTTRTATKPPAPPARTQTPAPPATRKAGAAKTTAPAKQAAKRPAQRAGKP